VTDKEKLLQIAAKLLERTRAGTIEWDETADEATFETSMAKYSVNVTCAVEEGGPMVTLAVLNDKGNKIEKLSDFADDQKGNVLAQLYELARRKALRVDESLDDLLHTLDAS